MEENTITIVECRKLRKLIRDIKIGGKYNDEVKRNSRNDEQRNCSDLVSFHSSNIRDLREKFRLAVDNYLALCEKTGKIPR